MIPKSTRVSAIIQQIKNHPTVIALIFFGTVVISLSTFTDAAKHLIGVITPDPGYSPETARTELIRLSLPYTADAFIEAARQGDMHAVKVFLAAGMDPNATNGTTDALTEAVPAGHIEIVRALVAAKARISWLDLSNAKEMERADMLRVLFDGGPDAEVMRYAFLDAATNGLRDDLRVLLEKGVDVNVVGREALWSASGSRVKGQQWLSEGAVTDTEKNEKVVFLLERGVDVNAKNEDGYTPLHFAAQSGSPSTVHTLLTRGAEVNAALTGDHNSRTPGWTPLMLALYELTTPPETRNPKRLYVPCWLRVRM